MESKDFLPNFTGNLASDTVGATIVTVKLLFKKVMELKHSRDNYHQFRDMLNVMRSHLMEVQSSSSQYHNQDSPAIERCTKQLMPVLEEARMRFPEDLPSLLGSLTLHRNMEEVKMKLEAGFKELDLTLARQDLISKTALLQPPKPLMQPEPETGFVGDVIKTLEKRMRELIHHDNPARIIVVHGLGGVGKTTLLHKVYNSVIQESTVFSFSSKSWLTISQEYNVAKLQRTLAENVGMQVKEIEDEERLKMRLADFSKTRRFFVVLDDLWSQDFDVRKLGLVFGNGNRGSKVVITTRNMTIARKMGFAQFTEHIEVPTLNEGDSWEMFRRWCFGSLDTGSVSREKLDTAKTACKECKGLPLAIKLVAVSFLLHGTLDEQQRFLRQLGMADPVFVGIEQEELFNKLKLSYDSLPFPVLKKCFLYTACMFAEDEKIPLSKLIRMWICEGFLGCENDYYSSVQRGIFYFRVLCNRCLISISGGGYGIHNDYDLLNRGTIEVHDCVRDMAMIVGEGDAFISHLSSAGNFKRLSLHRSFVSELPSEFPHSNMMSLNLSNTRINKVPNDFFSRLFSLKVLDLSFTRIDSLPSSILNLSNLELLDLCGCRRLDSLPEELGNLVKLRFLDLSLTRIDSLSSSILNLSNLELLVLYNCVRLGHLPEELGKLVKLRFLDLSRTRVDSLPSSIVNLSNLELLDLHNCYPLDRLPEELGNLVKLRFLDLEDTGIQMLPSSLGNLTALKVLRMSPHTKHVPKSIVRLTSLEVLHICCDKLTPHSNLFDFKDLKEFTKLQQLYLLAKEIELHESTEIDWRYWRQLKDLRLHISKIPSVFSKIFENMVQLQRLELIGSYETDGFLRLPNLGNFPNLKRCRISCLVQTLQIGKTMQEIYIGDCYNLEQLVWPDDFCALKKLYVSSSKNLKSVGIGKGTHLKCLEIVSLNNLPSLEELGEEQDHWSRDTLPALRIFDISEIESSETCKQRLENLKRILSLE